MPNIFQKEFKAGRIKTNVRRHPNGSYEVRCQFNKHNISATSKFLDEAKAKFLAKLKAVAEGETISHNTLFEVYFSQWLRLVKKPYVKDNTYAEYERLYNRDLFPRFKSEQVNKITTTQIQGLLNEFAEAGKFRTAKAIYQLLKPFFDYAVVDQLLTVSPMAKIRVPTYEQEHGTAFTRAEEKALRDEFFACPSVNLQAVIFALYTGVRRSELASVRIEDEWIIISTGKQRKGKKEKLRKLPITPMLRPLLAYIDLEKIRVLAPDKLTRAQVLGKHHFHDLRHTFITRCQECGIARQVVSLWVGHAADTSITSQVYTHLEQFSQLQIEEAQKFTYNFSDF